MTMANFWASGWGWTLITVGEILAVIMGVLVSLAFLLLGRPQGLGRRADAQGPQRGRAVRPAAVLRRLLQVRAQGGRHPGRRRQGGLPAGAAADLHPGLPGLGGHSVRAGLGVSNINVGILYLLAISSLGVYGIIMGGWASNSKYPFLGALRSAAQMVSYEVSIGFMIITVILLAGSMNLSDIVEQQARRLLELERLRRRRTAWPRHDQAAGHVPDDGDVLHLGPGRNQPPAVRPARGGIGTGGRLSGRIFVDPLPAVHDRRICQHRADVRHDQRSCSSAAGNSRCRWPTGA